MKNLMIKIGLIGGILTLGAILVSAQGGAPSTSVPEAAEGLDLYAVAETFTDSGDLEKFEKALNSPENGINNLDLNNDGAVDFVRVTEQLKDDTHLIVLQTPLGDEDFQDVAVIVIEREAGDKYNLQIQGDATIYGAEYYVVPANNNFSAWNVVRSIFRSGYRAYVSPFDYRTRPRWWNVRRPVALSVYRSRTGIFAGRRNFVTSKTVTVKTINKINYRPRASVLLTKKNKITRTETTNKPRNPPQPQTTVKQNTQPRPNPRAGGNRRGKN